MNRFFRRRPETEVESGAEVDARSRSSSTPLHFAAFKDHIDVVRFLVENGADVNACSFLAHLWT